MPCYTVNPIPFLEQIFLFSTGPMLRLLCFYSPDIVCDLVCFVLCFFRHPEACFCSRMCVFSSLSLIVFIYDQLIVIDNFLFGFVYFNLMLKRCDYFIFFSHSLRFKPTTFCQCYKSEAFIYIWVLTSFTIAFIYIRVNMFHSQLAKDLSLIRVYTFLYVRTHFQCFFSFFQHVDNRIDALVRVFYRFVVVFSHCPMRMQMYRRFNRLTNKWQRWKPKHISRIDNDVRYKCL